MKHIAFKRLLRDIRKACKGAGIAVRLEKGKGDHVAVVFEDRDGRNVRLVWDGGREVSPGVQRGSLRYLDSIHKTSQIASVVLDILVRIFIN
jgi:hypothetical protein